MTEEEIDFIKEELDISPEDKDDTKEIDEDELSKKPHLKPLLRYEERKEDIVENIKYHDGVIDELIKCDEDIAKVIGNWGFYINIQRLIEELQRKIKTMERQNMILEETIKETVQIVDEKYNLKFEELPMKEDKNLMERFAKSPASSAIVQKVTSLLIDYSKEIDVIKFRNYFIKASTDIVQRPILSYLKRRVKMLHASIANGKTTQNVKPEVRADVIQKVKNVQELINQLNKPTPVLI